MKSIIQNNKECYICGTILNLENHHIFPGMRYRKLSDDYGLTVNLCNKHHKYVHSNYEALKKLQQIAQGKFEERYSREKFIKLFTKSVMEE